ncbi:MAG: hypothetical protein Q9162_001110 [Coniocarpon cinnabarinum]
MLGFRFVLSFFFYLLPNTLWHRQPIKRSIFSSFAFSQDQYVTFRECRYLMPVSGDAIVSYCKSKSIADHVERLECSPGAPAAHLHHLNCQPSDGGNVLLYFHGGGFGNPIISPGHVPFTLEVSKAAGISKVVILEYTLAPDLQYPGQLIQAICALRHLLETHKPSEITIGGDSAGGNLTLAVLAHMIKPSPYAAPLRLGPTEKLRGALMVSPWVKFEMTSPSYKTNAKNDFLNPVIIREFVEALAPKQGEVYAVPFTADQDFWRSLPATKALLTSGTWEIFDSDIRLQAEKLGAKPLGEEAPVELALADKETHIQAILDIALDVSPPQRIMLNQVLDWCRRLP